LGGRYSVAAVVVCIVKVLGECLWNEWSTAEVVAITEIAAISAVVVVFKDNIVV
jgi:hypothetical protein